MQVYKHIAWAPPERSQSLGVQTHLGIVRFTLRRLCHPVTDTIVTAKSVGRLFNSAASLLGQGPVIDPARLELTQDQSDYLGSTRLSLSKSIDEVIGLYMLYVMSRFVREFMDLFSVAYVCACQPALVYGVAQTLPLALPSTSGPILQYENATDSGTALSLLYAVDRPVGMNQELGLIFSLLALLPMGGMAAQGVVPMNGLDTESRKALGDTVKEMATVVDAFFAYKGALLFFNQTVPRIGEAFSGGVVHNNFPFFKLMMSAGGADLIHTLAHESVHFGFGILNGASRSASPASFFGMTGGVFYQQITSPILAAMKKRARVGLAPSDGSLEARFSRAVATLDHFEKTGQKALLNEEILAYLYSFPRSLVSSFLRQVPKHIFDFSDFEKRFSAAVVRKLEAPIYRCIDLPVSEYLLDHRYEPIVDWIEGLSKNPDMIGHLDEILKGFFSPGLDYPDLSVRLLDWMMTNPIMNKRPYAELLDVANHYVSEGARAKFSSEKIHLGVTQSFLKFVTWVMQRDSLTLEQVFGWFDARIKGRITFRGNIFHVLGIAGDEVIAKEYIDFLKSFVRDGESAQKVFALFMTRTKEAIQRQEPILLDVSTTVGIRTLYKDFADWLRTRFNGIPDSEKRGDL